MTDENGKKVKRITVKTETGSKWFDNPQKLLVWIREQKTLYHPLNNEIRRYQVNDLLTNFNNIWSGLEQQIIKELQGAQADIDRYNDRVDTFSRAFNDYISRNQIFTSEAEYYTFFEKQLNTSPTKALALLVTVFDKNVTSIDRQMLVGLKEAENFLNGSKELAQDVDILMNDLRSRWDEEFTAQRDHWLTDFQTELERASEANLRANDLIEAWQRQTDEQSKVLIELTDKFKHQLNEELDNSKKELENLTKTYDDKLALHASVKYWGLQHANHKTKALSFAIALGIMTAIVLAIIIGFSSYYLDQPLRDIAISRLVTTAALTTFGIWVIKILANIFMSHLHLATDAQERRTMIHTYLALTRKGQGPREEDRQLILQTLFRPSTTDMVKGEQGPSQLVDLINRLSPRQ